LTNLRTSTLDDLFVCVAKSSSQEGWLAVTIGDTKSLNQKDAPNHFKNLVENQQVVVFTGEPAVLARK
jgi:hypothetical protein